MVVVEKGEIKMKGKRKASEEIWERSRLLRRYLIVLDNVSRKIDCGLPDV